MIRAVNSSMAFSFASGFTCYQKTLVFAIRATYENQLQNFPKLILLPRLSTYEFSNLTETYDYAKNRWQMVVCKKISSSRLHPVCLPSPVLHPGACCRSAVQT